MWPQPLSPSHTGPHWLRIWEVRRAQKELPSAWLPILRNTGPGVTLPSPVTPTSSCLLELELLEADVSVE